MDIYTAKKSIILESFVILFCLFGIEILWLTNEFDRFKFLISLIYFFVFTSVVFVIDIVRFEKMKNESFAISQTFGTLNLYEKLRSKEIEYRDIPIVVLKYFVNIAYKKFVFRFICFALIMLSMTIALLVYENMPIFAIVLVILTLPIYILTENLINNEIERFLGDLKKKCEAV